ncbi:hypothetical protein DB30_01384 [Enhygromyxa salina]|uniref:DUF952 domain-containing protein n=1 Tax=Enhygromyxa salina TaxID=215803 RepID=A0A0C2D9P0_9BACT|nr:DUF952 domain-containing protein [Enhygromyxa salina]KIG18275.1 hypothetical protein DB30_01384 [Enhygromyxa salina]
MQDGVYRICAASDWAQTTAEGQLPLSPLDQRDGYVHLSTAAQVPGTLRRFFAGREDLVLLSICRDRLGDGELRYEQVNLEAGSEAFPHFYGRIGLNAIFEAAPLTLDETGQHQLPPALIQAIQATQETRDPSAEVPG